MKCISLHYSELLGDIAGKQLSVKKLTDVKRREQHARHKPISRER